MGAIETRHLGGQDLRGCETSAPLTCQVWVSTARASSKLNRFLIDATMLSVNDAQQTVDGDVGMPLGVHNAIIELLKSLHFLPGCRRAQGHPLGCVLFSLLQPADKALLRLRREKDRDGIRHQASHRSRALHINAQDHVTPTGKGIPNLLLRDALIVVIYNGILQQFIGFDHPGKFIKADEKIVDAIHLIIARRSSRGRDDKIEAVRASLDEHPGHRILAHTRRPGQDEQQWIGCTVVSYVLRVLGAGLQGIYTHDVSQRRGLSRERTKPYNGLIVASFTGSADIQRGSKMPIYEYVCRSCNRRTRLFMTYAEYDRAAPTCVHCGSGDLKRRVGRVAVARSEDSRMDTLMSDDSLAGLEDDPRAMGRFMREMSREMGEEMGDEFEEVAARLEKGESPESIEASMPGLGDTAGLGDDF